MAYALREGRGRKPATVWAYLKVTLIDFLNLRRDHVTMFGWKVEFPSSRSLRQQYEEIFLGEHYRLEGVTNAAPFIVDAGANIGLATLYFKVHYPAARIICFEPHPVSFCYLKKNLAANDLNDVEAHQVALGATAGAARLYGQNLGASLDAYWNVVVVNAPRSEAVTGQTEHGHTVSVRPLSEFIDNRDVDILKLDIEGHEGVVLKELGGSLRRVRHIIMEYHRWPGSTPLSHLLAILEANGHDYDVKFWLNAGTLSNCMVRTWARELPVRHEN
jgi:FkbM family methyltransferase